MSLGARVGSARSCNFLSKTARRHPFIVASTLLHPPCQAMLSLSRQFLAICLVVLAASPFTAPFATCDLSRPIHHPSPIGDQRAAPGLLVKAPTSEQKQPLVAVPALTTVPLFNLVAEEQPAPEVHAPRPARVPVVLRI